MRGFRQIRRKKGVYGLRLFRTAGRQSLCAGRSGDAALPGGNRHHPEAGGGRRHRAAPLRSARHRLQQVLHRHAATADSGAEYGRIVRHSGNSDFQQIYRGTPTAVSHSTSSTPPTASCWTRLPKSIRARSTTTGSFCLYRSRHTICIWKTPAKPKPRLTFSNKIYGKDSGGHAEPDSARPLFSVLRSHPFSKYSMSKRCPALSGWRSGRSFTVT